jgi:UDP-GlcNAc:undecaprenyl-phosphate GlcNAc-1-phosphate transferase
MDASPGMPNSLLPFAISLLLSIVLGAPASYLAKRMGLIDVPGSAPHKQHARPTPLAGGILLAVSFLGLAFFYRTSLNRDMLAVLSGALVIFLFGLWDDRKGLSAGPKLIGQLIASIVLIWFDVQVRFVTVLFDADVLHPIIAQSLNIMITLFWLIGITNAMNMIDSMDGIVTGLTAIASALFIGAASLAGQPVLAFWAACLFGVSLGLYFWNGIAVKFFLGDSGAQPLGFLLASFGILYNPLNRAPESSWIVPIMLLGVPIFDTTLVVLSRLRRRQSIGSGRRDHTYHRFIRLGMLPRYAVLSVHAMGVFVSALAFATLYLSPLVALLCFVGSILSGLTFLFWLERQPTLDENPEKP